MEDIMKQAVEKLESEAKNSSKQAYVLQISTFLIQRCQGDIEFSKSILQEGKDLKGCLDSIINRAKKVKQGNVAVVDSDTVFKWATGYYTGKSVKKAMVSTNHQTETTIDSTPKAIEPKPKKKKEVEGQMDLFSLMGGM